MPTYVYECEACGELMEEVMSLRDYERRRRLRKRCRSCKRGLLRRRIGPPAGIKVK
jgi:putative FmdB family regulatory protein